jgi:glycogen operon protein
MITAGDEAGRTQNGNNNAYALDDRTSWVSWDLTDWQHDLLSWAKALTALRRDNAVLRQQDFFGGRPPHEDGRQDLTWFMPTGTEMTREAWVDHDQRTLGCYLAADFVRPSRAPGAENGNGASLLLLFNTGSLDTQFTLPTMPWASSYSLLLDTTCDRPLVSHANVESGSAIALAAFSMQALRAER